MRPMPFLLAVAFLASCASAPKRAAPAERPVRRAVVAPLADGRVITFVVDGAWAPMPRDSGGPVVLQHLDARDAAIAVYLDEAALDSTVESALARWAMMLLSGQPFFPIRHVANPVYPSETEGWFVMEGEDKGVEMVSKCHVFHLGDRDSDYWALVVSVSPAAMRAPVFAEIDRIVDGMRLVPMKPAE
jgi:hypothetical protein